MVRSIVIGLAVACMLASAQSRFIQAELVSGIKMKKAKVGDPVKAQTTVDATLADGTSIPAGSILLGQLRSVEPNAVSISFDAWQNGGKKTPLKLSIRAAMMPSSGDHGGRNPQRAAATTGSVIGLDGVTLKVDDAGQAPTRFESAQGELKIEKGLQLMLAPPE
jgi:hypothetical protein